MHLANRRSNKGPARENTHISDARIRLDEIKAAREESYLGPVCFGPAIRKVQLPSSLGNVKKIVNKYNGIDKPDIWLPDYIHAIDINDGDYNAAVRFLPLMLEGTARLWIDTLPEKSIHNWQDMQKTFMQHFSCTYKRPKAYSDLLKCAQVEGESSRAFIARWTETKNACEDVSEIQAIHAFMNSLKKGNMMRYMLASQNIKHLGELLDSANNYAAAEDDARADDGDLRMDIAVNPEK